MELNIENFKNIIKKDKKSNVEKIESNWKRKLIQKKIDAKPKEMDYEIIKNALKATVTELKNIYVQNGIIVNLQESTEENIYIDEDLCVKLKSCRDVEAELKLFKIGTRTRRWNEMTYKIIIKAKNDGYKAYSSDGYEERYMNQTDELTKEYIDNLVGELIEINNPNLKKY